MHPSGTAHPPPWSARWGRRRALWLALRAALVGLFAAVLLRTAWVCDDAYITFRTCHNLIEGFGPRWNVAERVQTFTNPLWMLLVSAAYTVAGNVYASALALSFCCSLAAFGLVVFGLARGPAQGALAGAVLLLSKAFVDFSTSGLENPLTHLLLALFALALARTPARRDAPARGHALLAALCGGLLLLNRLDAAPLVLPPLAWQLSRVRRRTAVRALAVGLLPLCAWLAFAVIYYGTPIPNSVLAKTVDVGVERAVQVRKGLLYLVDSAVRDPLTLLAIAAGLWTAAAWGKGLERALAAGVCLHLAGVVFVGGDFMTGRFLAAPLLVCAVLLARLPLAPWAVGVASAATAAAGLLAAPTPTLLSGRDYEDRHIPNRGITDERGFYFQRTGLFSRGEGAWDPLGTVDHDRPVREPLALRVAVGKAGFDGGPRVHVVDVLGICDPLLARLPSVDPEHWLAGHVPRRIPAGYLQTLRTGTNRIADPDLARYYERLALLSRGPLWSSSRWSAIRDFALGRCDPLLAAYVARARDAPLERTIAADELAADLPAGTPWYDERVLLVERGLRVELERTARPPRIEVGLDANDDYRLAFLAGARPLAELVVRRRTLDQEAGLAHHVLDVPAPALESGYDAVAILPILAMGDGIHAVGYLRLP